MNNININKTNYAIPFLFALTSCIIAYGFELVNHTISIDVDVMDNYLHTIDLGRWGHALLKKYIFHEPWVPFFSIAFSLMTVSASSLVASIYLKLNLEESIVFSVLFVTFPQMAYQLQFSNQAETVGLALLFCMYSMIFFHKNGLVGKLLFVLINVFVISIYQSLVFLPVTLVSLYSFKRISEGEFKLGGWFKESVMISLLTIISVIIYFVISKQLKSHYQITDVSYFSQLIAWNKMGVADAIISVFKFILYNCYTVTWYGFEFYFLTLGSVLLVTTTSIKFGARALLISLFISFIVILSPFILNILIGSGTPARTLSQMPMVFALTVSAGLMKIKLKPVKIAIILYIALSSCAYINILFYSDKIAEDQTKFLSQQIIFDIYHIYPEKIQSDIPIYFYGKIKVNNPWRQNRADEFGISFYERGESDRIGNYIRNTGIANIIQVSKHSISSKHKRELTSMPSWPATGSIKDVSGTILVKLSD